MKEKGREQRECRGKSKWMEEESRGRREEKGLGEGKRKEERRERW